MRRTPRFLLLAAALAAAPLAAQAQTLQSAELSAQIDGGFDFRGRTMNWHFTADGRVAGNSTASRLALGGMGETFGIVNEGTWHRAGNFLCIQWQRPRPQPEACYTVTLRSDGMTVLSGPEMITGQIESAGPNPNIVPAAPPSARPDRNVHRIPGAR
ncbi:MAG: hypothetical protein KIT16_11390 [Rhodospirillaceae bacterium]|nr:hypothetical protein [Rhodospirillaceae bacterium]